MKIIIAPTYRQAEHYRREQNLDRLSVSIVYDASTAYAALAGRIVAEEDVIDLGRPTRPNDAETIDAALRLSLGR